MCRFRKQRGGAILVAVLVCAMVAIVIANGLVQTLVRHNRQLRAEQQSLQAAWLAESAAQRAAAQLDKSQDYNGETWQIAGADLHGGQGGVAMIRVESVTDQPNQRRIIVQCVFPNNPIYRTKIDRQYVVTVKSAEVQP